MPIKFRGMVGPRLHNASSFSNACEFTSKDALRKTKADDIKDERAKKHNLQEKCSDQVSIGPEQKVLHKRLQREQVWWQLPVNSKKP